MENNSKTDNKMMQSFTVQLRIKSLSVTLNIMKKIILILVIFIFSLSSSQARYPSSIVGWSKTIRIYDLVEREGLYYEKSTNVPFTGQVYGTSVGKIKNGKKEGEWLFYQDEDGELRVKYYYREGRVEGEYSLYWFNGQLMSKGNFKDSKREGEFLSYRENGQLFSKQNYKDGKSEGEQLWYDENGWLEKTEIYKDGKLIKTIKLWDLN